MTETHFERRKVENVPQIISYKWSPSVVDEGYIPFPKRLLRCLSRLINDTRDIQVILAIVDYARPNLTRPPSYDYLAFNAGLTVAAFKDRVDDLTRRGWLRVTGSDEAVTIRIDGLLREIEKATVEELSPMEPEKLPF